MILGAKQKNCPAHIFDPQLPGNKIVVVIVLSLFILRERKSAGGKGAERRRDRIPSRLRAVSAEPDAGLEPVNREIMT